MNDLDEARATMKREGAFYVMVPIGAALRGIVWLARRVRMALRR